MSVPLSLAPALSSKYIFAPSTDVKLKHGILGLLKHIAQSANLSPIIPKALAETHVVQRINESEIWDEGADQMAIIVQLNAIGVVKHLCNADREFNSYYPGSLVERYLSRTRAGNCAPTSWCRL